MTSNAKDQHVLFIACAPGCLDIHTLNYRWFVVLWHIENEMQVIDGFWFADTNFEALGY